jgi:hypothetical protein
MEKSSSWNENSKNKSSSWNNNHSGRVENYIKMTTRQDPDGERKDMNEGRRISQVPVE